MRCSDSLHYSYPMSNLIPERRMNKNGVWSTKYVRADHASSSGPAPFPQVKGSDQFKGLRETLAQASTHYLTSILLDNGYDFEPVNGTPFNDECYARFMTFSDDTLVMITQFGIDAVHAEDAVYEYDCMALLISAQAEEADFINVIAMGDFLAENDVFDADEAVSLTLPLKLYDRHINSSTGNTHVTLEERKPYYAALLGATIALEHALGQDFETTHSSEDVEEDVDAYDDDDYVSAIFYHEIAPDQSGISSSPVIEDDRIIELVIRNVDRCDEINAFIKERRETDPVVLTEYLNAHPRPVASGAL